jgi:hypothetical protein
LTSATLSSGYTSASTRSMPTSAATRSRSIDGARGRCRSPRSRARLLFETSDYRYRISSALLNVAANTRVFAGAATFDLRSLPPS